MKIAGKIVYNEEDIRRLVAEDIRVRFGILVNPPEIWLGLIAANETRCEAVWNIPGDGRTLNHEKGSK